MKCISITRDHRERFTSKVIRECERYVGKLGYNDEIGIDDQYTQFFFSAGTPVEVVDWVLDNRYSVWHLLGCGIEFNSFDDFIFKVNKLGLEWDEEWDELDDNSTDD